MNLITRKISNNTALSLAQQSWPKVNFCLAESEFQRRLLNIFEFTLSFFQLLFKRWVNNKPKLDESSLLHIFYYILQYIIIPSLTKRFEMMMTATLRKNLTFPMPKTERRLMSSGRLRFVFNIHFFVSCQIDVENKQHFSPLSQNNSLSKIKFHSLISLKRNSHFMRYSFIGYQSGKWSENFLY